MKKIKKIRFKFFNKILHNKFIKKIKLKNRKKQKNTRMKKLNYCSKILLKFNSKLKMQKKIINFQKNKLQIF